MENSTTLLDVEGFVAVDTTNKLIVASFRGTCGIRSSANDASALFQERPFALFAPTLAYQWKYADMDSTMHGDKFAMLSCLQYLSS